MGSTGRLRETVVTRVGRLASRAYATEGEGAHEAEGDGADKAGPLGGIAEGKRGYGLLWVFLLF